MSARPLSRSELVALLDHFAGSPYAGRLEQLAAHDAAQREIISAQAREIARLAALLPAQPAPDAVRMATVSEEDECPCCLTHSCPAFRRYVASVLAERAHRGPAPGSEGVREAAERLRASLVAVPSWEALLPKNCGACEGESDCAGEHEPCGCHETLAVIEASLALLSALRSDGR